jgi:hypothetical protein
VDRFLIATNRLTDAGRQLVAQTQLLSAMRDDDAFPVDGLRSSARALAISLAAAASDPTAAVDEHQIDEVCKGLAGLSQDLRSLIERRWADIASRAHLADVAGLLEALIRVETYRDRAEALLQRVSALRRDLDSAPVANETDYRNFQQALRSVLSAVDDLRISDKPGLEDFLKDAAGGGATLSRLTEPIIAWINEQGLSKHFVIRAGSPRA